MRGWRSMWWRTSPRFEPGLVLTAGIVAEGCWPGVARRLLTFFASPKKVSKKRRPRSLGPCASLRATCGARAKRGQKQLASLKQVFALIRLSLRSSAQPGRGNRERGQKTKNQIKINKDTPRRVLVSLSIHWYLAVRYSLPPTLVYAPRSGGPDGSGQKLV